MNQSTRQTYRDISDAHQRAKVGNNVAVRSGNPFFGLAGAPGLVPDANVLASLGLTAEQIAALTQLSCNTGCCPVPADNVGQITLVGLPNECIDPCECGHVIETTVCAPLTFMGLFVPSKIANCLSLTRLRVGCQDILINCEPIPMELFSCCEIDDNLFGGRTVAANSMICLTVDNKCKAELEFEGAVKASVCLPC